MKISIITPSYNSGDYIERAIRSVLLQSYSDFEHIIVDGGSSDDTLDILRLYPHLKWISEPDSGQVDAMNKGFHMSKGELILNLNADDYLLPDVFPGVIKAFKSKKLSMLVGNIWVYSEEDNSWWDNIPKVDFDSMLHHWEGNAFCVNPVGYFYRRQVQESIRFKSENDDKMDLEFLLDVAQRFPDGIKKCDIFFGVFYNNVASKTHVEQSQADYWRPDNFAFLDRFLQGKGSAYIEKFRKLQLSGYAERARQ